MFVDVALFAAVAVLGWLYWAAGLPSLGCVTPDVPEDHAFGIHAFAAFVLGAWRIARRHPPALPTALGMAAVGALLVAGVASARIASDIGTAFLLSAGPALLVLSGALIAAMTGHANRVHGLVLWILIVYASLSLGALDWVQPPTCRP